MADKIKKSYKFSKSFYDDAITQGKWWSKLYFKLLWGGVDDNEIARRVLSWIPDDFKGKMLDVPVGTAVFTTEKYKRMKQTDITCLDRDDPHGLVYASFRHGQRRAQASGTLLRNPRLPRRGCHAVFQGQKEIIRTMKFTLTDRLMWHFMQGTCYKVLRAEYPEWDFHQLRKAAKERFSDILTSTPSIGSYRENSLKKNLVGGMVWFAIYETAKERYGSQMSLPLYEKMCRASIAMPMMLRMARMTKPFTRKFQESMMKRSERENRIDSPYNWQAHYKQGKVDEEFTLSYTRCGLCELARKRGHMDIQKRNAKRKRQEC